MLFLLNDQVIEVELPEQRLERRWRTIGCGSPHSMRARDALEFVRAIIDQSRRDGTGLDEDTAQDIAALIIAKTGANAAQFVPVQDAPSEARLTVIEEPVLQAFRMGQTPDWRERGAA